MSLKKTFFEDLLSLNESYNIGYTQISWWQLYEHSSLFRETNYLPEFFINFPISGHGTTVRILLSIINLRVDS
ncbi:phospholipase A [Campylobacter lari]|uniref:phospholipase A n=1 Tax=Campylobacter lari TaxID=201 RepID=UPI0021BEBA0F|nr:phospholipase A [Campylobacter lari]